MPGHKGKPLPYGLGIESDLTELPNTDDLYAPSGAIAEAQQAAARSAHAANTILLTNGATAGILTMLLYAVPPGGKVIMPRGAHISAASACALGDLRPVFANETRRRDGLIIPDESTWLDAIREHPDASAVFVVSPLYDGLALPLERIASAARLAGMRLLVDQAHGAHWNWWESPADAGRCGASLWVQSAHKTLPVPTQGAWLHLEEREDANRARSILRMTQTSSPSFMLMEALHKVRAWMDENGARELSRLLARIPAPPQDGIFDPRVSTIAAPCPVAPNEAGLRRASAVAPFDRTRIVLDVSGRGYTGFEAARRLAALGIDVEASDDRRLILIATIADDAEDFARLTRALEELRPQKSARSALPPMPDARPQTALSPRAATFARSEYAPPELAAGRVAACPFGAYPPGAPIAWPGEIITAEAIDWMLDMRGRGMSWFGADAQGLRVVCNI
ncbi:MAG: DegT/DnrJ/EryC1/StrS family aminotransferase [Oscillospiraceae bacterium]|nr:DegT/DnrJ/EryC1/StrS family aminotransferase [Oscillospiraceae bacterium]